LHDLASVDLIRPDRQECQWAAAAGSGRVFLIDCIILVQNGVSCGVEEWSRFGGDIRGKKDVTLVLVPAPRRGEPEAREFDDLITVGSIRLITMRDYVFGSHVHTQRD
jgi:hypothetical protein